MWAEAKERLSETAESEATASGGVVSEQESKVTIRALEKARVK